MVWKWQACVMQAKPFRPRRKHCVSCRELFDPDPRSKDKQHYCSKTDCQTIRQRRNEKDWRKRNPDCVAHHAQKWRKNHPDYNRQRRAHHPELLPGNREQTSLRMQKLRGKRMCEKSKSIVTELTGAKADKCYLTQGGRGLYVRLTKASPLSKSGSIGDNRHQLKRVVNRLPRGRLYALSTMFHSWWA